MHVDVTACGAAREIARKIARKIAHDGRRRHALVAALLLCVAAVQAASPAPPAAPETASPAPGAAPETALRATLDRHLAAINARDLDGLLATVTRGERLTVILPDGRVLATRDAYRRLHADWFAERDWRMVFEVAEVHAFGDTGLARVRYDAQVKGADGAYASRRIAWLTLVFAREDGAWRLVYDQNTPIPGAAPAPASP